MAKTMTQLRREHHHKMVAQGLCRDCTKPIAENSKSRCEFHLAENRRFNREWRKRNR